MTITTADLKKALSELKKFKSKQEVHCLNFFQFEKDFLLYQCPTHQVQVKCFGAVKSNFAFHLEQLLKISAKIKKESLIVIEEKTLTAGSKKVDLTTLEIEDGPIFPPINQSLQEGITIDKQELNYLFNTIAKSNSSHQFPPLMHFEIKEEGHLNIVTTNGHELTIVKKSAPDLSIKEINMDPIELIKLKSKDCLGVSFGEEKVSFFTDNLQLEIPYQKDRNFPFYEKIIPLNYTEKTKILLSSPDLIEAIEFVTATESDVLGVDLKVQKDNLTIDKMNNIGGSSQDVIQVETINFQEIAPIRINPDFLLKLAKVNSKGGLGFYFDDPNKVFVCEPKENIVYLAMPILIN